MPISTPNVAPTLGDILADFPRFDTSRVTDPDALQISPESINFWIAAAAIMLGPSQSRWGNSYYLASEMFVLHNVALEAWAEQGGNQTIPGITKGPIAGNGAGDVSVSYNSSAGIELDAGHWNNTTYGTRFIRLVRVTFAGPLQVGVSGYCAPCLNGPAYAGPWVYNFPNPSQ